MKGKPNGLLYIMSEINSEVNEPRNVQPVLKMLEQSLERMHKDLDTLDSKARANIQAATIILGLIGALQIIGQGTAMTPLAKVSLIAAIVTFAFMVAFAVIAIVPKGYYWPLKAERNNIREYLQFSEIEYNLQIISDYISAIEANRPMLEKKSRYVLISTYLFGISVFCVIVAAYIHFLV
jgi:hypothetical protein